MNPSSVRFRITAIATIISTLVLGVAAIVVVVLVQQQLIDNLDRTLAQRADQIEGLAEPSAALDDASREDRFAQILDAGGTVLFATVNVAGLPSLADLPTDRQEARSRADVPIEDDRYRVLIRRFDVDDSVRFVVVGENIDDVSDGVRALMVTLAIVFPVAVAALAAAVWWLVGRTLRPVEQMRRQVASIGLDELDRRVPAPGSGDEIDRLASTMNDMLARLETSSAAQRRFVADVSHELRTPLTRLRTALEVDLVHPDADLDRTARAALDDAIDMQALVDDLLFLARHDAGASTVHLEPIDLDVIVGDEVRLARATTDIDIDMSAVSVAQLHGDRRQLERVIRNVLSNALRHGRRHIVVQLREIDDDDVVELTVDDDGSGIPSSDRDRVFERFVRVDASRSAKQGGTGLGLAIVRDIVHAHGGSVAVLDAPIGGARLRIRLPRRAVS